MLNFIPFPYNIIAAFVGAIALVGVGAAGGHYVTKNADTVAYQKLQLAQSQADTASVTASLNQLKGFISKMDAAGGDYSAQLTAINQRFASIEQEFKNATRTPLPADCRPDVGRLRLLTEAVAATASRRPAVAK